MVLQKITPESRYRTNPEMRIIPESKVVIPVIVGYRPKVIMIGYSHKKKQNTKKDENDIWNMCFSYFHKNQRYFKKTNIKNIPYTR